MKRLYYFSFLLLVFLIPAKALAHDFVVNGVYYNINGNNATVTYRGTNYFQYDEYSGSVTIPSTVTYGGRTYSVTAIGDHAFDCCTGLTRINIPNSVTTIGESAFCLCTSLTNINIPNSVTTIGGWAFQGCSGLTSVTIGNSVTEIGQQAFDGCTKLMSVTIPNSVTSIGSFAFWGCTGLTSVTIGNSVTRIDNGAFNGCSGLTSVTIGNSVTSIGNGAFNGCSGLTSVTIPDKVTSIEYRAFSDCTGLTSVTIGNSVTDIDPTSFQGCTALETVNFNAKACNDFGSYEEYRPFYNLNIKTINIGDNVQRIPAYFAYGLTPLTSVTIGNSVTSIGEGAFEDCTGLTRVNISDIAAWCNIEFVSIYTNPLYYCGHLYLSGSEITELTIPNSVTNIKQLAFFGCSGLTSVTIGNSVTSIGLNAFGRCSGLTNVTIPNSVTYIGESAFSYCTSLTNIDIPNSVTTIEWAAFCECSSLTSINIPNSVTTIGGIAFAGTAWYNNQPDGLIYAGLVAYEYKGMMPSGTSITLRDGTLGIAGWAFDRCTGLTNVTIPNSVTYINYGAFYGCSGLTEIYSLALIPPTVDYSNSFSGCNGATLYVPKQAVNAYKAANYWKDFTNIIGIDDEPGDVNGDGNINISDVTALINLLLSGGEVPAGADVNGDGQVNISDVTALINRLLSGN